MSPVNEANDTRCDLETWRISLDAPRSRASLQVSLSSPKTMAGKTPVAAAKSKERGTSSFLIHLSALTISASGVEVATHPCRLQANDRTKPVDGHFKNTQEPLVLFEVFLLEAKSASA